MKKAKIQAKIQKCLDKDPILNYLGRGIRNKKTGKWVHDYLDKNSLKEERNSLLYETESFIKACKWLLSKEKIKSINDKRSSYALKHIAEFDTKTYFANGVFIAAAMHCNFKIKYISESPNVYINISEKSIKPILQKMYAR